MMMMMMMMDGKARVTCDIDDIKSGGALHWNKAKIQRHKYVNMVQGCAVLTYTQITHMDKFREFIDRTEFTFDDLAKSQNEVLPEITAQDLSGKVVVVTGANVGTLL